MLYLNRLLWLLFFIAVLNSAVRADSPPPDSTAVADSRRGVTIVFQSDTLVVKLIDPVQYPRTDTIIVHRRGLPDQLIPVNPYAEAWVESMFFRESVVIGCWSYITVRSSTRNGTTVHKEGILTAIKKFRRVSGLTLERRLPSGVTRYEPISRPQ